MNSNRDSTYFQAREPLASNYRAPRNSNHSTSRYFLRNNIFVPPQNERIEKGLTSNMSIINSYQQHPSKKTTPGLEYTAHHTVHSS